MMRFRLLGPLEVRAGDDWKGIGAPKWRSVLAALLINAGQIVSADALINEVWQDAIRRPRRPISSASTC
jgi:DNA-binding SARP family transcriptional activator